MLDFYGIETLIEQFVENSLGATILLNLFPSAISLAAFVLTGFGLYAIAKRRGIHNPWLSWIPVANCWIIGCLSDQYRYVVKGEVRNKRKALLTLNIINVLLGLAIVVFAVVVLVRAFAAATTGGQPAFNEILGSIFGVGILFLPFAGVSIAITVIHYMATYDIYTSCDPQNNVLFLVLSIFFPVLESVFMFFSRKKDEGMPPRRQEPQYSPQQPQCEPSQFQ